MVADDLEACEKYRLSLLPPQDVYKRQIWVCPSFNHGFDFTDGAWETLDGLLADLAEVSGYKELSLIHILAPLKIGIKLGR